MSWRRRAAVPMSLAGGALTCLAAILAGAAMVRAGPQTAEPVPLPHRVYSRQGPLREPRTALIELASAPFPYEGGIPPTNRPFFDVVENGRRGHRNQRGGVYWEDETYADPRVLLHIPSGFDVRRPGLVVMYLHGHGATLHDVEVRQQIPAQIAGSAANAVLVAPQFAVDAVDSSPGKFWEEGGCRRFLAEAAGQLARLHGDPRSAAAFASMPVVIVAYSGGYLPAAWCVRSGGIERRLLGVVLLDALYGELDEFAWWIESRRSGFFVSAYLDSTRDNNAALQRLLAERAVPFTTGLESRLGRGSVAIVPGGENITHRDLLTRAWVDYPLRDLLDRLAGYRR